MKIYEFGKEHTRSFAMFQCAVEPWWVFKASAEEMAKDYHVYLFIADGHDELGTEFISLEKYAKDAAAHLRSQGIGRVDAMYGVSMGGAAVIRFLATEDIPVEKAIIDAGITPYPCRIRSRGRIRKSSTGTVRKKNGQEKRNTISNLSAEPIRRQCSESSKAWPMRNL